MKLETKTYIFMIVLVVSCISCQQRRDLTTKLISIEKNHYFCFDSLYTEKRWDCVYILEPYTEIDKINIDLDSDRKQEIHNALLSDGVYTILFTNENKYTSYQTIPRKSLDFSLSGTNKFDRHFVFYKDTASVVKLRK